MEAERQWIGRGTPYRVVNLTECQHVELLPMGQAVWRQHGPPLQNVTYRFTEPFKGHS